MFLYTFLLWYSLFSTLCVLLKLANGMKIISWMWYDPYSHSSLILKPPSRSHYWDLYRESMSTTASNPKFCSVCGKKLLSSITGRGDFDTKTGREIKSYRRVCPSYKNGLFGFFHNGHDDYSTNDYLDGFWINRSADSDGY